ncbi:MAG TPA: AMP-binding protein, partial [Caulobacter sp.]|nr:AMP-binding protein [Caulobacter sp.]
RAGLYYVCVSTKLTAAETQYILQDCGAKVFITSTAMGPIIDEIPALVPGLKLYAVGGAHGPYADFEAARAAMPETPISDESAGSDMLYSSGTTGRPKGVKPALSEGPIDAPNACGQFVPTHFVRMLKLPEETRAKYDVSSMKSAVHAAAPCPVPVKEQMIAWWGPVIFEYYAGTEGNGFCWINSDNWLTHKGSVGQAVLGELRICDEDGNPVPPRTEGTVYFANGPAVNYHNAPDKTAESYNQHGWTTLGDVGWADEEGYLYLTDRKSFMIISGGVNIYPQEIENLLITHPKVADAAVVGAPCDEMGEKVVAVIQPLAWAEDHSDLADELMAFARANLSHVKSPRRIDFMQELPRHATGKLYKRLIRDAYWAEGGKRIG